MARRIIGVSKRLIEVAREEFMSSGFEGASIRSIAQKAETSPRAIYTRFENKEELFAAVIGPTLSEFMRLFFRERSSYWERMKKRDFSVKSETIYKKYLDFAYAHREDFLLLLLHSNGTRFAGFTEKLAAFDLKGVRRNVPKLMKSNPIESYDGPTRLFFENITCAFYRDIFAPLLQGMSLDDAYEYICKLTKFYEQGISHFATETK